MGRTFQVLAVEDDENDAAFIERAAMATGFVRSARVLPSGEEAQEYLSGSPPYQDRERHPLPDLVLLDLRLRRMSGLDLLRWIRRSPSLRFLPVVVITGVLGASTLNRAYELGVDAYLIKPLGIRELSTMIAGVLVTLADRHPASLP